MHQVAANAIKTWERPVEQERGEKKEPTSIHAKGRLHGGALFPKNSIISTKHKELTEFRF